MTRSKLFWKLFLTYAIPAGFAFGALTLVLVTHRKGIVQQNIDRRSRDVAAVLQDQVTSQWDDVTTHRFQEMIVRLGNETSSRITVVDADGTVLADSTTDQDSLKNQGQCAEIVAARHAVEGWDERASGTLGTRYYARRIDRSEDVLGFVRIAIPVDPIYREISTQRWVAAVVAVVATTLALVGTYLGVRRILEPVVALTRAANTLARGQDAQAIIVSHNDELGALAAAFNQMTEQMRGREQQYRETTGLLSTVLGGMSEGVLAVDPNQRVMFANLAAGRAMDFDPSEVKGKELAEVTRDPILKRVVSDLLAGGHNPTPEDHPEFTTNRNPSRVLAVNATRLPGNPCNGGVVVFHDVTEERELLRLRQEFVANVSHDLKTPLSSIKALAETLQAGAVDDPNVNRQFLAHIEAQADRLYLLILDMIRLGRIESGQRPIHATDVWLRDVVGDSLRHHDDAAARKQIRLVCHGCDREWFVRADETALRRILDNLIENAIKYSPEGSEVEIGWQAEANHVVIQVRDHGIGIKSEDQSRVFERFYRVDRARSGEVGSTGLGLSIVKHLARALEGSVSLESEYGKGTTFFVRLPLAVEAEKAAEPVAD